MAQVKTTFPLNSRQVTRNRRMGVFNGVFIELAMALTNPGMVLAVLVRQLGGSNAMVGLLPTLRFGGWFLPQFLVGEWVQSRPRRMPVIVALDAIRIVLYAAIGGILFVLGTPSPLLSLWLFLALFTITRFSAGAAAVPRLALYGSFVPTWKRASFLAAKSFWGGLAAFGAGFVVQYALSDTTALRALHVAFPNNFGVLFVTSALCFGLATLLLSRSVEPPTSVQTKQRSLRAQLQHGSSLLKADVRFRRYAIMRTLVSMLRFGSPFYVVYALDVLHAPPAIAGTYLSMLTLARILSNPLWRRISDRRGDKCVMQLSTLCAAGSALLAVAIPALTRAFHVADGPASWIFGLVLFCQGAAAGGHGISLLPALLDIAPPRERASYIGLLNTILGPTSFVSILSGALIDTIGFAPLFLTAAAFVLAGFLVGTKLQLPQARTISAPAQAPAKQS